VQQSDIASWSIVACSAKCAQCLTAMWHGPTSKSSLKLALLPIKKMGFKKQKDEWTWSTPRWDTFLRNCDIAW